MTHFLEQLLVRGANRLMRARERRPASEPGVLLGRAASDNGTPGAPVRLEDAVRSQHVAIVGKTGSGKTSLIRVLGEDDIRRGRGFVSIDLHGDTTPFLLRALAAEEKRRRADLSERVVVIDPSDPAWAVGLNPLEASTEADRFVQLAEVAQLLKLRWDLASFGPRTEELLRSSLFVLSAAGLTLVELAPLLTDGAFRAACLRRVTNREVASYFRDRYDAASDAMQAVMRDAVLNKTSAFTADPHFRHILGQANGGVDFVDALDRGCWVLLKLPKGRLGDHAATLGSLFLARLKRAVFARRSRSLVTVYADELQNLVDYTAGIDAMLAESRAFSVGFCSANQYLEQFPPAMRAAVLSVGTHIFFQLSAHDAERANALIGGGKTVQQMLKELPARHAVIRRGGQPWKRFKVLDVEVPDADPADLVERANRRWARRRDEIEREIDARRAPASTPATTEGGDLDGWE
jgi:hypothetical protein